MTVVWIAQRFTEEHRAALDWLNRITHADFRFFGIEVELWRIGDSALAPKFNVVAKPNEWAKTVRETAATESPERAATLLLYADYWQGLADLILDCGSQIRPPRPAESHFVPFPIGKTNYSLGAIMSTRDGWIGVTMLIDLPHEAVSALDMLALDADGIERDLGFPITWDRDENRRRQGIHVRLSADPNDHTRWPELHAWTLDRLEAFDRVFRPRIRLL